MHGLVPHRPDVQQMLHLLVHHCRCLALICLMGYLHHHNHPVSLHDSIFNIIVKTVKLS